MAGTTETATDAQLPLNDCTNTRHTHETRPSSTSEVKPVPKESTETRTAPTNENATTAPENTMEYHRQMLKAKLDKGEEQQSQYVSPSDDIMSPCTKKLTDIKAKRFKNVAGRGPSKSQAAFARTLGRKAFEAKLNQKPQDSSSPLPKQSETTDAASPTPSRDDKESSQ